MPPDRLETSETPPPDDYEASMQWWPRRLEDLAHSDLAAADRLAEQLRHRLEQTGEAVAWAAFGWPPVTITVHKRST